MKPLILSLLLVLSCSVGWAGEVVAQSSVGDYSIPVQTLVLEAGGEGFLGMVAVGEVIRNRAFKAHLSPEQVVMMPKQFSCWNKPLIAQKALSRVSDKTLQVARQAWDGSRTLLQTRGSTHYCTLDTYPYWAVGHVPAVIIGHHKFYNDVK